MRSPTHRYLTSETLHRASSRLGIICIYLLLAFGIMFMVGSHFNSSSTSSNLIHDPPECHDKRFDPGEFLDTMAFITPVLRSFLRPTRPRFSTKSIPLHQTPQPTTPSPSTSLPNKINKSNSRDTQSQTNHGNSHEPPPPPPPSWFGHPFRVILTTLKFVAFTHLIWEYVISMAPASGPSMLPTFEVLGEWLLVSKLHRFGRGVTVGDVVAYNIPINDEVGVKRVLGMPGDYVLMDTPGDGVGLGEGNMIQVCEPWSLRSLI